MRKTLESIPFIAAIVFFVGILGILISYAGPAAGISLDADSVRTGAIKIAGIGLVAYVVFHFLLPSSAKR